MADATIATSAFISKCSADSCHNKARWKSLCRTHYARMKRLGRLDLPSFEERFWNRIDRSAGPEACWPWTKSCITSGYGRVYKNSHLELSHRVAWELSIGPIPDGLHILHKCDNPPCCNPNHLFPGTDADNMRDMFCKGRANRAFGERQGLAKLTDDLVRAIRKMRGNGISLKEIAKIAGITPATVSKVVRRKTWRHVQ